MNSKHQGKGRGALLFGLGLAAGALGGLIAGRRTAAPRRMPHAGEWQRRLAETRGPVQAALLLARAQARHDELYAHRPRFANGALRGHFEGNILPGLALYQVLREEHAEPDKALAEMEAVLEDDAARFRERVKFVGHLPDPFTFLQRIARWSMARAYPPEGWEIEWIEDSDQCVSFDIRRCFYQEVLTAYGAPELTPLYCKMDDLIYEGLPPSITWERTKTLGRGDDACDFRWCRAAGEPPGAKPPG
jgi:hypothetical protein